MSIGENIKKFRKSARITQKELARRINKSYSSVQKYELDLANPSLDVIRDIAAVCGVDSWEIIGFNTVDMEKPVAGLEPLPKMNRIPLLGSIACGTPIAAEENVEEYVNAPADINCSFVLRCKGDSMVPRVVDGDLVYIRQQPDVEDGQIAAVIIDGEATLKHVYHIDGGVQLVSDNPVYRPLMYTGNNCDELRIVGLAVAYQRML
ncbi:MAG: helix-turn-helix domain-containing protein [Clostridia bacterium]|nr:helix-turn-helix domain-containing protein [Clostridia bacterium]